MAKVTFTSPVGTVSGRVGGLVGDKNGIVYSTWKGIAYIKTPPGPNDSASVDQQVHRGYWATAVNAWQAETTVTKGLWNTYATTNGLKMSGFNFYVQKYVKFLETSTGTPPTVTNTPPNMS